MGEPARNLEIARSYLRALERGETGAALGSFFESDVVLEEFPNRVTPLGKRGNLAEALEAAEQGKKAMSNQIYKVKNEIAEHEQVALEVEWIGTLAVPFGWLAVGSQMKAFLQCFWSFGKERLSGSEITIASRPGSRGVEKI